MRKNLASGILPIISYVVVLPQSEVKRHTETISSDKKVQGLKHNAIWSIHSKGRLGVDVFLANPVRSEGKQP